MRVQASCHCGNVVLDIQYAPETVTDCSCSLCRRYGVLWAYYAAEAVHVASGPRATETYSWKDHSLAFHRCRRCGCVTHWCPVTRIENRMGINARLLAPDILAKARVRRLDGAVTGRYLDE